MADSAISGLSAATAVNKSMELEVNDAGTSKKITAKILAAFCQAFHMARIATARTLTNTTAVQAIFDSANDTLTLETGTYIIEGFISLSSMSATSGNAQFGLLGGGSAVLADILINIMGVDGATATAATRTGSTQVTATSPASALTAGTGTGAQMQIKGSFEVTTAGTIIPSVALVTAAAAVVAAGSCLQVRKVGEINMQSIGDWA